MNFRLLCDSARDVLFTFFLDKKSNKKIKANLLLRQICRANAQVPELEATIWLLSGYYFLCRT